MPYMTSYRRPSQTAPATDAQVKFLQTLLADRQAGEFGARVEARVNAGTLTKVDASAAIDWLKGQPKRASRPQPVQGSGPGVTEPGLFKQGDEVYLVVKTKDGQRLYAKRLVNFDGTRLNQNGEHVKFEWVYAPGIVGRLAMTDKMTVEDGKAFMLVYNSCLRCNRHLRAATSVERGIGPVCIKYFA